MTERTKHHLLLIVMGLTTVPFFFLVQPPQWGLDPFALKSIARYFSAAFGYIGISFLIWQLILGTRSISGLFFTDLVSKIKIHKALGVYGTLLIFLHPLLITYNYGESVLYGLIPNRQTDFEIHVTYGRFAMLGLGIIWVTSALVRGKIAYRPWKYIHYIAYPVLLLSLLHAPGVGTSFPERGIQFFWLLFCVIALIASALRLAHFFGYGKLLYTIVGSEKLPGDIVHLTLMPKGTSFTSEHGQYIYLQTRIFGEEHPFSILKNDPKTGELQVAFKIFGKFTTGTAQIAVGDTMLVDGPYGIFTAEKDQATNSPAVYIAGGIGITPFMSQIGEKNTDHDFLFWANRTPESAVFRETLKEKMGSKFIEVYSEAIIENSENEVGYLSQAILEKYLTEPKKYVYYVCGPKPMMKSVKSALHDMGIPIQQIYSEEFTH